MFILQQEGKAIVTPKVLMPESDRVALECLADAVGITLVVKSRV